MHNVRPYQFFNVLEAPPRQRVVQTTLPSRRGSGGLTILEMTVIMAALRVVEARQVFEIGTFLGSTTLNLALNIPDDGKVFTLDLDEQHAGEVRQDVADAPLTGIHLASKSSLDFIGSPVEHKIKMLTGDSTKFDFSPWHGSVELVFIDGGHDFDTVKSDTENAFRLANKDRLSCVLWHDYRNRDYSGLTYYLDELSRSEPVIHIEDTMLCAWFNEPDEYVLPRILSAT